MNDFTKEEIQELLASTFLIYENRKLEFIDNLRIKLQYMIDNYCTHKSGDTTPRWYTCRKCGRPYLECDE